MNNKTFTEVITEMKRGELYSPEGVVIQSLVASHEREVDALHDIINGHKRNEERLNNRILELEEALRKIANTQSGCCVQLDKEDYHCPSGKLPCESCDKWYRNISKAVLKNTKPKGE